MEERKTIYDYLGQVFSIYGIMAAIMNVFCVLVGEDARELSSMFSLGSTGISVVTMAQFLLVAVCIVGIRFLFFTDVVIKQMSLVMRVIFMVVSVIGVMTAFIVICDWFPTDMPEPWLMFLLCFFVCFVLSIGVMLLKERAENAKMEAALNKLKRLEGQKQDSTETR